MNSFIVNLLICTILELVATCMFGYNFKRLNWLSIVIKSQFSASVL